MTCINYECKKCGGSDIEVTVTGATVTTLIVGTNNGIVLYHHSPTIEDADNGSTYKCKTCGDVICYGDDDDLIAKLEEYENEE